MVLDFDRAKRLLGTPASGPACIIMGATMFAFGLPFLTPWYPAFLETGAYRNMSLLASPLLWGMLLTFAGAWRISAAAFLSYKQRKYSTAFAIFLWCLLFLLRVLAEPSNPGVTVFATWMAVETWTLFRLHHNPAQ